MDGCGQLALEAARELFHFGRRSHSNHESKRTEYLFAERMVGQELRARRFEEIGRCVTADDSVASSVSRRCASQSAPDRAVGLGVPSVSMVWRATLASASTAAVVKRSASAPSVTTAMPGLVQKLPGAHGERTGPSLPKRFRPCFNASGSRNIGLNRAELAEERDRFGAPAQRSNRHVRRQATR